MQRARPLESGSTSGDVRGAASAAPRATPLTIVSGAVAGDDLERVARSAADAIGRPVAISLPARGAPTVWPPGAIPAPVLDALVTHAGALIQGADLEAPPSLADVATVRIGHQTVGIVAAVPIGESATEPEQRAWLEAAAAAAAVTALMQETQEGDAEGSRRALLQALRIGPPSDLAAFIEQARRLGLELGAGAIAICARTEPASLELPKNVPAGLADVGAGKAFGLMPLGAPAGALERLTEQLRDLRLEVALSSPRKDPAALHEALCEADLMLELGASVHGQEETYRLLIGVLLRDPEELESLRATTVSALSAYDERHDTELLTTLQTFLAHHGSTTETAEAMALHRHTVGYRLARVHEVSGLSPYESEGRERLSLGLKADQILTGAERLSKSG